MVAMHSFGAMKITVSANAIERVVRWPEKNRSKRLHKKMTKRLGEQYIYKPAALKTPFGMVMHPTIYESLKQRLEGEK